ncbi:MAG: DUF4350 domain-containing protein [Planctomycetota bacterium]
MSSLVLPFITLVAFPHGGHLQSGTTAEVGLRPLFAEMPETLDVSWQLTYGEAVVGEGGFTWRERETRRPLRVPEVRTRLRLRWHYQIRLTSPTATEIDRGTRDLWVHPPSPVADPHAVSADRVGYDVVLISVGLDRGLASLLRDLGARVESVTPGEAFRAAGARLVVVGRHAMTPRIDEAVGRLLRRGAGVVVLPQMAAARSLLAVDEPPDSLRTGIDLAWLEERLASAAGEPVLWTKRTGPGLAVGWRFPVADWAADPVGRQLMHNALHLLILAPPSSGPDPQPSGAATPQPIKPHKTNHSKMKDLP